MIEVIEDDGRVPSAARAANAVLPAVVPNYSSSINVHMIAISEM